MYTRDDETTRQFIDNPVVSLSEYSQPNPFVPIYAKLKERRDSRVDRMIVYQSLPHRVTALEAREFITKLNDSCETSGNFLLTIYISLWLSFLYHLFSQWDILV